jgi:DNA-binding response OmpR family regulator
MQRKVSPQAAVLFDRVRAVWRGDWRDAMDPAAISALVVDPIAADRVFAGSALAAAGFHVTVSHTFASAKDRMAARRPAILITEVCLAEYNGIHLVIRGMATGKLAAVVTCDRDDPVLRDSAEKLGATFVVKPVTARELLAAVMRTLLRSDAQHGPIRAPFERRTTDRRASTATPVVERRTNDRRQGLAGYHSSIN